MKQVFFTAKGELLLRDVPAPVCAPGQVLVRAAHSVISSGTEGAAVAGGGSLLRQALRRPDLVRRALRFGAAQGYRAMIGLVRSASSQWFPTGYSAAGVVVEAGPEAGLFAPGDRVACAGAGHANHAEFIAVPANLAVRVPAAVTLKEAAFATLGAIALQGVRRAEPTLGETMVVVGTGLIGLLTVQILLANGCRVIALDLSPERLARARALGAAHTLTPADGDPIRFVLDATGQAGADAVILTAGTKSSDPVNQAFKMLRERGRVVVVGAVGMDLERGDLYNKEIDLRISRSYGPGRYDRRYEELGHDYPLGYVRWTENRNLAAFLDLVAAKRVDVLSLVTHEYTIADAPQAYAAITGRGAGPPALGVLLTYPGAAQETFPGRALRLAPQRPPAQGGAIGLALVGAGQFARAVHVPNLKALKALGAVHAVAGGSGGSARQTAEALGAPLAATGLPEVLQDPAVTAVLIATRHNLHAAQCIAAAQAGRHIFVEKPLGLTVAECQAVVQAVEQAGVLLAVGFNRRLSALTQAVRAALRDLPGPRQILCRVNAGPLPADHWTLDPAVGGGRIVGEGCHFFDLMAYLIGAEPVAVSAQPAGASPDDVSAVVRFADGSLGTLVYTGLGDPAYPKERVEVFAGGGVAVIDDFRAVAFAGLKGKSASLPGQDKGHRALLENFLLAALGRAPLAVNALDGLRAGLCAEAALRSLQSGAAEPLSAAPRSPLEPNGEIRSEVRP